MDLLFNDLSIHGQFHDRDSFHQALERLMEMCTVAERFNHKVHFTSARLFNINPMPNQSIQKLIHEFPESKRRSIMAWLDKGPFWDVPEQRKHSENDLLECVSKNYQVVTNTAVGEAAFRILKGSPCEVISLTPSDWQFTLVEVICRKDDGETKDECVKIKNVIDSNTLKRELQNTEKPIKSWNALQGTLSTRFPGLMFTEDCFEPLTSKNIPFKISLEKSILRLLDILNRLALEVDENGRRTAKGEEIHDQYFKRRNAPFSDSSDTEKQHFEERLTFPHPERPGHTIFCSYHGKVPVLKKELTIRLHFSWPIQLGQPVYVVYIGPKLTKR